MINSLKIFFVFVFIALLSSCCADVSNEKFNISNSRNTLKNPTSIAINKSTVTAKVEEILLNEKGNLVIKTLILKVEVDPSYPNLSTVGKIYNLTPNFVLDDEKKIILDSERNKNLSLLSKQNPGYEFKAIIFYDNSGGWLIQEVIPN